MLSDYMFYLQIAADLLALFALWRFYKRLVAENLFYKTPLPRICHHQQYVLADAQGDRLITLRKRAGVYASILSPLAMLSWVMVDDNFNPVSMGLFYLAGTALLGRITLGMQFESLNDKVREDTRHYDAVRYGDIIHPTAWTSEAPTDGSPLPVIVGGHIGMPQIKISVPSTARDQEEHDPTPRPMELEPSPALRRALIRCKTGAPPEVNAPVVVIYKDASRTLRIYTDVITAVEPWQPEGAIPFGVRLFSATADGSMPPWRVTVDKRDYYGATIAASFLESDGTGDVVYWIATAEAAHVLIASLAGLSDLDRDAINELINPGREIKSI